MRILIAVVNDLYTYCIGGLVRLLNKATASVDQGEGVHDQVTDTEAVIDRDGVDEVSAEFKPIHTVLEQKQATFSVVDEAARPTEVSSEVLPARNTIMYVGVATAYLYTHPTREFDTVCAVRTFGSMVMVLEQKGRWVHVACGEKIGWVLRDDLAVQAADVFPSFMVGAPNMAESDNTKRVRGLLVDMFHGDAVGVPLQAGEYVTYALKRKGLSIEWPETRPRTPGAWHTILKGVPGIHSSVHPHTGSVMEYMLNEYMGHVTYVEAVFPDGTLSLSEANYPTDGIYNERILTKEEWKELRPIFIQVL